MRAAPGLLLILALVFALSGCSAKADAAAELPGATELPIATQLPGAAAALPSAPVETQAAPTGWAATEAAGPARGAAPTLTPQPAPTFDPESWSELPVIPELGPRALEILQDGLEQGRDPHAFSKIGDCESQASWFLEAYDLGADQYSLGSYEEELAPVVEYYAGSHKRLSLAAKPGFTAASLLAPIWADRAQCEKNETPLDCELRVHNPLVAFVMIGTNDASNPKTFEGHLRKALDRMIAQGVLPILGTKADNVEGDHYVNAAIARVAYEYGLPLWNYWAAVQDLPGNGLQEDGVHLTFYGPFFDNPYAMERAWPVRNLNALQVLERVMQASQ